MEAGILCLFFFPAFDEGILLPAGQEVRKKDRARICAQAKSSWLNSTSFLESEVSKFSHQLLVLLAWNSAFLSEDCDSHGVHQLGHQQTLQPHRFSAQFSPIVSVVHTHDYCIQVTYFQILAMKGFHQLSPLTSFSSSSQKYVEPTIRKISFFVVCKKKMISPWECWYLLILVKMASAGISSDLI